MNEGMVPREWFSEGEGFEALTVSRAINEAVLKASTKAGHNSLKLLF